MCCWMWYLTWKPQDDLCIAAFMASNLHHPGRSQRCPGGGQATILPGATAQAHYGRHLGSSWAEAKVFGGWSKHLEGQTQSGTVVHSLNIYKAGKVDQSSISSLKNLLSLVVPPIQDWEFTAIKCINYQQICTTLLNQSEHLKCRRWAHDPSPFIECLRIRAGGSLQLPVSLEHPWTA